MSSTSGGRFGRREPPGDARERSPQIAAGDPPSRNDRWVTTVVAAGILGLSPNGLRMLQLRCGVPASHRRGGRQAFVLEEILALKVTGEAGRSAA